MAAVILGARGLTRHFGGIRAVDGVDFDLNRGEIHALIGPNGAGKTTFVGLLCGRITPSAGTIAFEGRDITALPAHRRVRLGIAYTFQITSIYPRLSVRDNVALAAQRNGSGALEARARAALDRVGLGAEAEVTAANLSYGHQRLVEIAMGLALAPKLLILDEPTQGLANSEVEAFARLIRDLAGETTILLIEHNMDLVMTLAERITVLNFGRTLATGTPEEIRANPAVQAAYLGDVMLEVSAIDAGYGPTAVLRGVSLAVAPGEVLCVMGRNGAGKSTTLRAIMGLVRVTAGTIRLDATEISALPAHRVPREGIGYVPQGRRLFAELTVAENLEIGLMTRNKGTATRERVLALFPRLRERLAQVSGTLSGGEQQMLAIARALCLEPSVLLLDEPTEGLQPSMIALIRDTVTRLKSEGVAVVLVEQRIEAVLEVADRVLFLVNGAVAETLSAAGLDPGAEVFRRYVGV